jgi:hypothetical protein
MSDITLGARYRTSSESLVSSWMPSAPTRSLVVQYLLIGGGGGAGCSTGTSGPTSGGGGAGAYINSAQVASETSGGASGNRWAESTIELPYGNYSIIIGAGGSGATSSFGPFVLTDSTSGSPTYFIGQGISIIAEGGGRGGVASSGNYSGSSINGGSGGSGGGGGAGTDGNGSGGSGIANRGNNGGSGGGSGGTAKAGAGGGADTAGGNGSDSAIGTAGAGLSSSITGSALTRAAGASGRTSSGTASNGTTNRGNGGQGAWSSPGGNGGSGVVIIRYITGEKATKDLSVTGGTITTSGIYTVHTFNSSDTLRIYNTSVG